MACDTRPSEKFLQEFHRDYPGITARHFARGRTASGRSSYQILADGVFLTAPRHVGDFDRDAVGLGRIVDLGCGDGYLLDLLALGGIPEAHLIGIDLSIHELSAARCRRNNIAAIRGRAQALPLASGSVGHVTSHMALMLMGDLDPVLAEISRVLRPGGTLHAMIGGGPTVSRGPNAYLLFADAMLEICRQSDWQPDVCIPPLADHRLRTEERISGLFHSVSGFCNVTMDDVYVDFSGSLDQVWSFVSSVYEMYVFPPTQIQALYRHLHPQFATMADHRGLIPCSSRMRQIRCTQM